MVSLFLNPLLPVKLIRMARYLVAMLLFSRKLPKKEHYWRNAIVWSVFCLLVAAALPLFNENVGYVTFLFLIECILSMLAVRLCCKVSWTMVFYVSAAAFCAEHIASMIDSYVALINPELLNYTLIEQLNIWMLLNYALSTVIVYAAVYAIMFRGKQVVDENKLSFNAMTMLLLISLAVNLYMNLYYSQLIPDRSFWVSFFEYGMNIICSVFLLRIQSGMLSESQMKKRLEMTSMLWEQAREQYRISKENIEAINIKSHDLKHRLLAVKGATNEQEYADIMDAINSYGSEIETNNEVLDVVFQEKNFQCRKLGIQFTCIIDGAALNFMDTTDLYVLFGNMIDNCIEAVSRLEENEVKNIQVAVRRDRGFVIITTENRYVGDLQWRGGRLLTSKEDKDNHGYGMLSIENIVHKYGGRYSISTEDGVFCMNIVMPVGKAQ